MSSPRVLVVTSSGSPSDVVTPLLAALETRGLAVRAIDVGRVGARNPGTVGRVIQAVVGEWAERRLLRELEQHPPDVTIAFDPGSAAALSTARDQGGRAAPVVAVVPELEPDSSAWTAADADRYLTVDDSAAVALADTGVDGSRIMPVGPFVPYAFADAGRMSRTEVRSRFKLPASGPVVLVEVGGMGYEGAGQLALQLSLAGQSAAYLFAAGDDSDAATALRQKVPTLGIKAKMFGKTADAPLLWRAADIVVVRPRPANFARALAVGARIVALTSDDSDGRSLVEAVEIRRQGAGARGALFVSSALDTLMAAKATDSGVGGQDGAGNAADVAWIVGSERAEILGEARAAERAETRTRVQAQARAADSVRRTSAPAGDLEDLGWGDDLSSADPAPARGPDLAEIQRLRRELDARETRVKRSIADAQRSAETWQKKADQARKSGSEVAGRECDRNADLERARMHASLAELAEITAERQALDRAEQVAAEAAHARRATPRAEAPPRATSSTGRSTGGGTSVHAEPRSVDDMLADLKRKAGGNSSSEPAASGQSSKGRRTASKASTVDDELAALKRKMSRKKSR